MKIISIFLLFFCQVSFAQEKQIVDIRLKVEKAIAQHTDKELLRKTPKDFTYLFSVTLSFDKDGKVDTVYFPAKIAENVSKTIKLDETLVKRIKDQQSVYKIYAGKLVFIVIFYYFISDDRLDYRSGFIESFENLLPDLDTRLKKDWIILKPITWPLSRPIR